LVGKSVWCAVIYSSGYPFAKVVCIAFRPSRCVLEGLQFHLLCESTPHNIKMQLTDAKIIWLNAVLVPAADLEHSKGLLKYAVTP
jgi:hypothetical protein